MAMIWIFITLIFGVNFVWPQDARNPKKDQMIFYRLTVCEPETDPTERQKCDSRYEANKKVLNFRNYFKCV